MNETKLFVPLRIGVMGSGRGSNFVAIHNAIQSGELNAGIAIVISDHEDALILEHARSRAIRAEYIHPGTLRTRMSEEAERKAVSLLESERVDLLVLAGYMRMVKAPLLEAFAGRIINIHPSLLPAFPGLEAWKQALAAKVRTTGCTVHWVDAGMDTGAILAQSEVPVIEGDSPESLHARIQVAEHRLYPEVIGRLSRTLGRGGLAK